MQLLKRMLRFFAKYFVFVGGFLFIFVIGFIYAFVRPEGLVINVVFFIITLGWVVFLIKYFWDLLEKDKKDSTLE